MDRPPRRPRGATIVDVAELARVSPMTVSRVIRQEPNVRDATRAAVLAAIRKLNYAPNLAARSLVGAEEVRIGVIYSHPSAAFMSDFLSGVFEEAAEKGAQLFLAKGEDGHAPTRKALQRMLSTGVRGVVLAPPLGDSAPLRRSLRQSGISVAVVAAGEPPSDAICVRIDDRRAAYDMTRHLLDLGHRRLGFIGGNPNQTSSPRRLEGCKAAVAETPDADLAFAQGAYSYASGLAAAEQLLGLPRPPTAIFASNDDMAAAVVSVAHRSGLDVPRDLTVVGFDDSTAAVTLWPPLTTLRQPVRQMAATALDLLMQELRARGRGADTGPCDHVLEHALVERQSTAPPKA